MPTWAYAPPALATGGFWVASIANTSWSGIEMVTAASKFTPYASSQWPFVYFTMRPVLGSGAYAPLGSCTSGPAPPPGMLGRVPYAAATAVSLTDVVWLPEKNAAA